MSNTAQILSFLIVILVAIPMASSDTVERVPVPVVTIYPGDELTPDRLTSRDFVQLASPRSVIRDPTALIGKKARRTLLASQPILVDAISEPNVITQGVLVVMKYEVDGLSIIGRGVPLKSAVAGEMVEVRNPDTGAIVRGVVTQDGSVSVLLP